jgi:hypothetical protein
MVVMVLLLMVLLSDWSSSRQNRRRFLLRARDRIWEALLPLSPPLRRSLSARPISMRGDA